MDLSYKQKSAWENLTDKELSELGKLSDSYLNFLNTGKTERECTVEIIKQAKEHGFKSLEEVIKSGSAKKGTKVYLNNKEKSVVLMVLGNDITQGMNIIGAHIDSPRLDLKQMPLFEESNLAFLKTHYYGGVKKYQWTAIPLAIHGVIFTKEGKKVDICIGEDEKDPVLFINDLLIHLSKKQLQETMAEGITGEQLNILVGNQKPSSKEKKDKDDKKEESKNPIKDNILKILNKKYGIIEEDFRVAELEIVPAGKARNVGFDNSLIAGHGHDDRVCAYTALKAILEIESPERTAAALFADKEEIGSVGNTGMQAFYFENMVAEIAALNKNYRDIDVRRAFANSYMLSADVSAGFDPAFPSVFEKMNSSYVGNGICINKYTGSGGKGGSNDANAEFLQKVRKIFDDNDVVWQTGELGKIDAGGGGTIAYIIAKYGAEVVDCGVPVLSMHAPFEIISKADLYMAYRAYKAFYK
ncbi:MULTISPECIES: aminopeptidase [unclassified Treponema]|uniref:aminopeptidase n=1 Tax=unclassified Treponema TaxID=2638727 RepID=UPI0020A499F9|nr:MULTISPECIES: aminopeptidase [unclassified Treponema]UTC66360.1 aminopeptidase [Treponema sp. OMZ 789]UTC69090.1 aminopeptidase [Treponema sp. OMZ 790]UTC71802.1 aminopeptidase [Treponema sp. OMZ 791]